MSVNELREDEYLKTDVVRISIFLSLFDVHVNRAPIEGKIAFLGYFPGARFFTFDEKSSEFNQHNSILIEGLQTSCLVKQIVGPVARRVVYWLNLDQMVRKGDRIGMMKFGSRLDMLFPKDDVNVIVQPGDRVQAGVTVVAIIKPKQ
jgi:phosphatidylserine decarboxylase